MSANQTNNFNLEENIDKNLSKDDLCFSDSESYEEPLKWQKTLEITTELKEKLKDFPDVISYIEKLQYIIQKQVKKILKWKTRSKQVEKKTRNVSTQTDSNMEQLSSSCLDTAAVDEKEKTLTENIREAAELAMQSSGFVYEETSGLYYDYTTGYYYNAEYGLYYDGSSGTYLKYNQETEKYEFHSQVPTSESKAVPEKSEYSKPKRRSKKEGTAKDVKRPRRSESIMDDVEEGECSESSSSSSKEDEEEQESSESSDISKQWPPCMRMIVESTEIPKIKIGSLHIITCDGGTIGREGSHSLLLPDINVSKHHLKILFDKDTSKYMVIDLGSRNGTTLNGKRLSPSKQESEPMEIGHYSKLQIGSTILLCHIHEGTQTCGHCEPGLLMEEKKDTLVTVNKLSMNQKYKSELKKLKKQHGLLGSNDDSKTKLATGYTDRAQKRRDTVGSQNPYEKTETASLDEPISSQNKGFKLLSKMGWKEGQSLGKEGGGTLEPIKVLSNIGKAGIGAETIHTAASSENKQSIWIKTQERFEKLPETKSFDEESDEK